MRESMNGADILHPSDFTREESDAYLSATSLTGLSDMIPAMGSFSVSIFPSFTTGKTTLHFHYFIYRGGYIRISCTYANLYYELSCATEAGKCTFLQSKSLNKSDCRRSIIIPVFYNNFKHIGFRIWFNALSLPGNSLIISFVSSSPSKASIILIFPPVNLIAMLSSCISEQLNLFWLFAEFIL